MTRSLLLVAAASLALSACATDADMVGGAATAGHMRPVEREAYVQLASSSDLFEIQSGELAATRARSPAVREFAQMLVADHGQTTEQRRAAAKAAGMARTHDWMLPPPMQEMLQALQGASDTAFDQLYLSQQVQAHQAALVLHRNYAQKGDTPTLRASASAAVPVVQRHLDRARQLD
jgi:putative membrane protein